MSDEEPDASRLRRAATLEELHDVEEAIHEEHMASDRDPEYFKLYWRALNDKRCQWALIVCWLVLFIMGIIFGPMLGDETELDIDAPAGSGSFHSRHHFRDHFPKVVKGYSALVRSHCTTCDQNDQNIDDADTVYEQLLSDLRSEVMRFNNTKNDIIYNYTDLYTSYNACTPDAGREVDEADVQRECNNASRKNTISSDGIWGMAIITHNRDLSDDDRDEFLNYMDDRMEDLNDKYDSDIKTHYTGNMALLREMQEETAKDVDKHLYVVPLILLIFGYTTGTWRTVFVPLVAFMICISICFMIMYPIAKDWISVFTVTPAMMTSICLAICIDYSLFLLVRFREEIGGQPLEYIHYADYLMCVKNTLRWSGEVILVSGFILALSLMGYLFCELDFLRSFGIGCALAVTTAICLNLTLVPVCLIMFPEFFGEVGMSCRLMPVIYDGVDPLPTDDDDEDGGDGVEMTSDSEAKALTAAGAAATDGAEYGSVDGSDSDGLRPAADGRGDDSPAKRSIHEPAAKRALGAEAVDLRDLINLEDPLDPWPLGADDDVDCFNQCWYRCGVWTTFMPFSLLIIVGVYLLILPVSFYATQIEVQYAQNMQIPRGSDSWKWLCDLSQSFGKGILQQYYVLIPNPDKNPVWNETYITDTANIFAKFREKWNGTKSEIRSVTGVSVLGTVYMVDVDIYNELRGTSVYHKNVDQYVDEWNTHWSYFTFLTNDNPQGFHSRHLVRLYRPELKKWCRKSNSGRHYRCWFYSPAVETSDAITELYSTFPWILLVTMIVVFAICGLVWRNTFLPLRLFLTIALPMVMVFGWAVLVYQENMLGWWHVAAFHEQSGLAWICPMMCITLCFGLALDYDIFLWTRITEYLEHGVDMRTSVVRGVCKTGNIITSAGVIMSLAFGGLFFSQVATLNQCGFLFVVSVLIDTFIIRTSLVPAILAINFSDNVWHPEYEVLYTAYVAKLSQWWNAEHYAEDSEEEADRLLSAAADSEADKGTAIN